MEKVFRKNVIKTFFSSIILIIILLLISKYFRLNDAFCFGFFFFFHYFLWIINPKSKEELLESVEISKKYYDNGEKKWYILYKGYFELFKDKDVKFITNIIKKQYIITLIGSLILFGFGIYKIIYQ